MFRLKYICTSTCTWSEYSVYRWCISGLEVDDAKGSPAISNDFVASTVAPPGEYLRDDHNGKPGVAPWVIFQARLTWDGYTLKQPISLFEVYSGQGGEETVSMYSSVLKATK